MNTYVVVKNYAYEGEAVLTAGTDWNDCYSYAEKANEKLEDSSDSVTIYTFTNGIEVDSLEL